TLLVGHVTWQGRPGPDPNRNILPITLTLKLGTTEVNYPVQNTDTAGFFTVTLNGLSNGTYTWRVKDAKYLASSGTVALSGAPQTNVEMGQQRAGDSNNDNRVNSTDFNMLKLSFGKTVGDPGYDDRADLNGDTTVNT